MLLRAVGAWLVILIAAVPSIEASKCYKKIWNGCWWCGKAVNHSPWAMKITQDPHKGTCRDKCCAIYNWNDGDGGVTEFWKGAKGLTVPCTQSFLAPGDTYGGSTCDKNKLHDVDAFTFADREFVVYRGGKEKPTRRTIKRGVWVKFDSDMGIKCVRNDAETNSNYMPYCHFESNFGKVTAAAADGADAAADAGASDEGATEEDPVEEGPIEEVPIEQGPPEQGPSEQDPLQ